MSLGKRAQHVGKGFATKFFLLDTGKQPYEKLMKIPYDRQKVLDAVCGIVAEVLGYERDEVHPDNTLGDDLDADSLSFVEVTYSLEKRFNITLPKKSIIDHAAEQNDGEDLFIMPDGGLTEAGVFLFQRSFFDFAPGCLSPGMKRYAVIGATTSRNWASSCFHLLGQLPDNCHDCGHDTAVVNPNHTMSCGGCGMVLKPHEGDAVLAALVPALIAEAKTLAII